MKKKKKKRRRSLMSSANFWNPREDVEIVEDLFKSSTWNNTHSMSGSSGENHFLLLYILIVYIITSVNFVGRM